jgi:hypothetical protein
MGMPPGAPASRAERPVATIYEVIAILAILLLATGLTFRDLPASGWGNTYYATAVKSMLLNGHNFFYVAFDRGGYLSVDKPPRASGSRRPVWPSSASTA